MSQNPIQPLENPVQVSNCTGSRVQSPHDLVKCGCTAASYFLFKSWSKILRIEINPAL